MSTAITVAGVLGITSPALTIALGAPQAARILRSGAAGVSVATWIQALVLGELWAAYGFLAHVPAEVVTNIPSGVLALAIVVLVARRAGATAKVLGITLALSVAAAAVVVSSALFQVPALLSVVAVVGALGLYVPQLVKIFRHQDFAGISLLSWAIAFVATCSWTAYGIVIHKLPVVVPNFVLLPSALAIVLRVAVLRRRGRAEEAVVMPVDTCA